MKNIKHILLIVLLVAFSACEKHELMDYEGQDCLYFDAQYGASWGDTTVWAHQIYSTIAFGRVDALVLDAKVKVAVAGSIKDYDRPFQIKIVQDSTTLNTDEYDASQLEYMIPAGQNHTYVQIPIKKSERMSNETLQLQIALVPGKHFTDNFSEVGNIPGRWTDVQTDLSTNINPNIHNFFVNDMLVKPAGWHDVQFGKYYSIKKHALLLKIAEENFGFGREDFEEKEIMYGGRAKAIAAAVKPYLMEQYYKGREYWVLDEDGSMMYVSGVSWTEGTRPEDMAEI